LTILRIAVPEYVGPLHEEFKRAFQQRRFAAVVIDYEDYRYMGDLRQGYRHVGDLPGSFSPRRGPRSVPQKLYMRRD
jgi:hypothetical protein